jgi:CRISPR system Cascade subunit CasE
MHMIDLPLDAGRLMQFAWGQGHGRTADDDFGYATHAWLAATVGEMMPKPFRVIENRNGLRLLGYTAQPVEALAEQAQTFAEPRAFAVADWDAAASKAMPNNWTPGRRLGFEVRVCPVSRAERERDIFLVAIDRAEAEGNPVPERAAVYAHWLARQLKNDRAIKVEPHALRMIGFRRFRGQRIAHGAVTSKHRSVERPDALFSGDFEIDDAEAFARLLARGIGRHRAFGFGMLLLRPAGMGA